MTKKATKGFTYYVTRDMIKKYMKFSALEKLTWLAEANEFTYKALPAKNRKIWQTFRAGKI